MDELTTQPVTLPEFQQYPKVSWIVWAVIGIAVLILVIGTIAFFASRDSGNEKTAVQQNDSAKTQKGDTERSLTPPIDPECENAKDAQTGLLCYTKRALEKQDVRYCQHLPKEYQEYCEVQVYYENAKRQKNPELCEKIKQQAAKDNCYSEVAVEAEDPKICEKIQNRSIGKYYERVPYEDCYLRIAEIRNDSILCDKVISDLKRNNCYLKVGTRIKDPEVCKKITKGEQLASFIVPCYTLIAKGSGNVALCEYLESGQSSLSGPRELCIYDVAIATKNKQLCERLSDTAPPPSSTARILSKREQCIDEITNPPKSA